MAVQRLYFRSFAGGEVSGELWGRIDDVKYATGLAECRNFMIRPQGAAENRPGTTFVSFAKDGNRKTRVIPFIFNTDQSMVLELGHGYVRFHTMGQTLMSGGTPYELVAPWTEAMVMDIHYVQSADVVTLVHPAMPAQELRRLGPVQWELRPVDFTPPVASHAVSAAATVSAGMPPSIEYRYAVSRVRVGDSAESLAHTMAPVTNNLFVTGNKNTVTITTPAADTVEYVVYKWLGGVYGYVGKIPAGQTEFVDDNIAPDMSRSPPQHDNTLAVTYPAAVTYHEQRRVFGGPPLFPQHVWMTRVGTENQMTYSLPTRDDDRISFRVAARDVNAIRHIVPLQSLLLLTSSTEWRVTSVNSDAITPRTISVKPQSYIGASNVQPVVVNSSALFAGSRGGHLYEVGYNWQAQGFVSGDLSLRNPEQFDMREIVDLAYQKAPYPVVWAVSSGGSLLGLTYVPEQQLGAWHTHTTAGGAFESVCVVSEYKEIDMAYVVVRRQLGIGAVRCIERMQWRGQGPAPYGIRYSFFVDCGVVKNELAPGITSVDGLSHLEGMEVAILADGIVMPRQVVSGGRVVLPKPAMIVAAGLPIDAYIKTLPAVAVAGDTAFGQGRVKNVNKAWLRVHRSSAIRVGQHRDQLREYKQRTTEPMGSPPKLVTEEVEVALDGDWLQGAGQVVVAQEQPLPLTVVGMTLEVQIGG